jgi:Regulator of ribonuclease activity B
MSAEQRIARSTLDEMFASIRTTTDWPIDSDMLWGYFFVDTDREKLERAGRELEKSGYRFVGIVEPAKDDDDEDLLFLHVERIETHTAESLERRNAELYDFADAWGIATYDGMDVGPVQWS